uniref:Uncharacterized protein n=1 Tax=Palpitomonas bilix TaxID=652834 RepID=A0A7S3GA68_9EUKA|mmetsp:Transcript_39278/g.100671  ORF Transcript_39278/g.100671 Transcript_39278/m.100671 type:complete len:170 (+) Transcript_39278:382-891(+)
MGTRKNEASGVSVRSRAARRGLVDFEKPVVWRREQALKKEDREAEQRAAAPQILSTLLQPEKDTNIWEFEAHARFPRPRELKNESNPRGIERNKYSSKQVKKKKEYVKGRNKKIGDHRGCSSPGCPFNIGRIAFEKERDEKYTLREVAGASEGKEDTKAAIASVLDLRH